MAEKTALMTPKLWGALLTIGFGTSLIIMDATIVNVALPVVIDDLKLTATEAQWMNAVYSLVFAALLITVGRLGDVFGRRRLFLIGMVIFMGASVFAGLAQDGTMLIGARLVQGAGAAMVSPSTLSSLNTLFHGRARTIAFAVYGSAIGGMAAVGPLVGGWLATDVSWRWAFWLNIPVGILVVIGILTVLPETKDPNVSRSRDFLGIVLSSLGMAAIVFGLIEARSYGWLHQSDGSLSPIPFVLGGGVVTIVIFVLLENSRRSHGKPVLVDLSLFKIPTFSAGVLAIMIVALGEFGLLFALPLVLQGALGYTALGTGWIIVALAGGTFLSSGLLPMVSRRIRQRTVVQIGLALEALSVGALSLTMSLTVSGGTVATILFVYGFGVGFATSQLTSLLMSDVPTSESGQASGLQSTIRQLGSSLGVAILGGVMIGRLDTVTASNVTALGVPSAQADKIASIVSDSAGAVIPEIAQRGIMGATADQVQQIVHAASSALVDSAQVTTGAAALALVVGLLATLRLPKDAGSQPDKKSDADS